MTPEEALAQAEARVDTIEPATDENDVRTETIITRDDIRAVMRLALHNLEVLGVDVASIYDDVAARLEAMESAIGEGGGGGGDPGPHDHDELYAEVEHAHSADAITSGTVTADRLGSGTADEDAELRGDGVWRPSARVLVHESGTPPSASGNAGVVLINISGEPL